MRYFNLQLSLFGLLCMFVPLCASAQETKHVEVTTIYNPEVTPKSKLMPPASIADKHDMEPDIEYNVHPDTWQIELASHNFKPATAGYWDFDRARRCHMLLSAGYPLASDFAFNYLTQNARMGYFGIGLDHTGSFSSRANADGVVRSIADSYDTQNHLSINGGVVAGCQTFEAGLDYDFSIFNSYAELTSPSRLYFHDAELKLRYGDSFVDLSRLNFGVELHGGGWLHTPPSDSDVIQSIPEFRAGGSVRLARDFSSNVVGLKAEYDMWQSTVSSYRDIRFGLGFEYARDFGFIDVEASLGYLYDRVRDRSKASHFIMPALHVEFDFGLEALAPYVDLNTTVSQNGISELYKVNPFIDYNATSESLLSMPNTRSYTLAVGFTGVAAASRLAYSFAVGANFMRDQVLWYISKMGMFGAGAGDNNRLFVTADVEYHPIGGLVVGAKFFAHADNSMGRYVASDARLGGDINVKYSLKRWTMYVAGQLTGTRRWSMLDEATGGVVYEAFKSPTTFDLRAGVSFRATAATEIYVDGYNLLNSRIYDYAYYYRNGAGVMAGVRIDF